MKAIDSFNIVEPKSYNKISDVFMNAFRYFWDKEEYGNSLFYIQKAKEIIEKSQENYTSKSGVYIWFARLHKKLGNTQEARIYKEKSLHNEKIEILDKYDMAKDLSKPDISISEIKNNTESLSYLFPNLFKYLKEEKGFWEGTDTGIVDNNKCLKLVVKYSDKSMKSYGIKVSNDFNIILFLNKIENDVSTKTVDIQILNDLDKYLIFYGALEDYLHHLDTF